MSCESYRHIALALDPEGDATAAIAAAAKLARTWTATKFSLVQISPQPEWPEHLWDKHGAKWEQKGLEARLARYHELLEQHFSDWDGEYQVLHRQAKPSRELLTLALEQAWDLLIFINKQDGYSTGALLRHYAEQGPSDLLQIQAQQKLPFQHLVCGTDFSAHALEALKQSAQLQALARKSGLHLYHSGSGFMHNSESRRELAKDLQRYAQAAWSEACAKAGLEAEWPLILAEKEEREEDQFLRLCEEAQVDLIVLGSKGHSASELIFLGSFSAKMLNSPQRNCALLLVKTANENQNWLSLLFA